MKYKKSELDLFLQGRIRENKEELSRNLDACFNMNKIVWKKKSKV